MSDIIHGKSRTITQYETGAVIVTDSFYDGEMVSERTEYEIPVFTTKQSLLKDVIEALSVLTSGDSNQLHLDIQCDNKGRWRLTKRWTV